MNILIVDDNLPARKLLKNWLQSFGQCDMVNNGREAVDLFAEECTEGNPYDLILLDIMMPVMDGQMALKEIRRMEREFGVPYKDEVVIIMVTAVDTAKDVGEAYTRGGCTDYITKPISKDVLLKKLKDNHLI